MILLVQIICLCYTLYVLQEYATSGAYSRQHRLLPLLVGLIGVYNFYQVVLTLTGQTELFGRLKDMLLIQVLYLILIYIMDFLKIHIPYGVQWSMFCVLLALNVIVFMRYRQPEIYHIYFRIYLIGCTAAIVAMGTYAYLRRSLTMHEHQIANLLYIVLLVNAAAMCAEKFFTIPGNLLMLAATTGVCGAVHYLIQTDDRETREGTFRLLLQALYANNRLQNKRYCFFNFIPGENFSSMVYDCLYKSAVGGAIVVRYLAYDDTEDDYATCGRDTIELLCEIMKKYRNQVLTVFCLPRECTTSKDIFYENLGNTSIVEFKEEFVSGEYSKDFLRTLAKDSRIRTDKKLFEKLENEKGYLTTDLHNLFDDWYNNKLKTAVYPQYKDVATVKHEVIKAAPKGSAYDELKQMIGLDEAKRVIDQALNYYKAQKLFADKGMKTDHPAMHMIFTGNPGTAKTNVARLFAKIMKENDLLSKGNLVEVGRGDLVGKYVGWTAPTIQKKFKEAQGSVLFIDEAYSLVDDRNGSFGDEAINTIVQEMENHRDDVVVIFAGYPDKMEGFLQKNPGLRSRIAYHVPFDDYDTESLCEIAKLIAKQKGLSFTEEAYEKLSGLFDTARSESDFGNGRYVRNVIEKAKMAQATRLLTMDFDSIGSKEVTTITAEDIELPKASTKSKAKQIGFCA